MKKHGKLLLKYLLLFVMTVFVMGCFSVSAATKTGFVTQKGKTYYINKDGSKQKGWGDGEWMRDWEARMQSAGAELVGGAGLMCHETPDAEGLEECKELGRQLANA